MEKISSSLKMTFFVAYQIKTFSIFIFMYKSLFLLKMCCIIILFYYICIYK